MRKITGLCFLTATLLAGSAHAQSLFIEKGDPNAKSAMIGGGLIKDAWGITLLGGFSYRGVFDVGLDFTRYAYTGGDNKNLAGYSAMPFVAWHPLRTDMEGMPISLSLILGVQRVFYSGNDPYANPEGWGLLLGPSVYRRFEFGSKLLFIPEVLLAYDMQYTRFFTVAANQPSGHTGGSAGGFGYDSGPRHGVRLLLRPNLLWHAGNARYLVVPYLGYQSALAFGINLGMLF